MVTLIYSLGKVTGAEEGLIFWLLCGAGYIGLCFLFRVNREKQGRRGVFIALLAVAAVFDFVWFVCCYDHGQYVNRGLGAVYALLLWVPALLLTAACVTVVNKRRG